MTITTKITYLIEDENIDLPSLKLTFFKEIARNMRKKVEKPLGEKN
ncbi:hypothetical protein [Candidatus Methanoperedens sp. BLZ2]